MSESLPACSHSADDLDRIAPTLRPAEKPVGFQTWRDLFFLHWSVPAEEIRKVVPAELELDLYDEKAWLGIVPFKMRQVRPAWAPAVPGFSNFLETNVRTYVHYKGEPGVWFISLDADATVATLVARAKWNLNYCRGRLGLREDQNRSHFTGRRQWPRPSNKSVHYDIRMEKAPERTDYKTATPGTFEHFLVERYLLFTLNRSGKLLRGQVHHQPYPFIETANAHYTGTLADQVGLPEPPATPEHALYSPGVTVEMFALREV